MTTPKPLVKTLLSIAVVALFSATTTTFAEQQDDKPTVYTDPVTGEVKHAPKLLSQMTDEEKAQLSDEEYQALKDLEVLISKQRKAEKETPGD